MKSAMLTQSNAVIALLTGIIRVQLQAQPKQYRQSVDALHTLANRGVISGHKPLLGYNNVDR